MNGFEAFDDSVRYGVMIRLVWRRPHGSAYRNLEKSSISQVRNLAYGRGDLQWARGSQVEAARAGDGWLRGWLRRRTGGGNA